MSIDQETIASPMSVTLRPFREEDYPRMVEIGVASFPDDPWSVEEARHWDASWDHERYAFVRWMAEDSSGRVVAYGRCNHIPWEFDPGTYYLSVTVDPLLRRRRVGGTLYDALFAEARRRAGHTIRSGVAKETMTESVSFLSRRGFEEVQRGFESRLNVEAFDFDRFTGAEERVAAQEIVLTTLAAEQARDPEALRQAYELQLACGRDVPAVGRSTDTSFELFRQHDIDTPTALLDAFFLAKDGARYVGLSLMQRRLAQPQVLSQHLTGLLREYRGKGIAMALKLQTVKFARAHGYQEIRTNNDARNRPMLRINEAMGFVKQPAWITYQKRLG